MIQYECRPSFLARAPAKSARDDQKVGRLLAECPEESGARLSVLSIETGHGGTFPVLTSATLGMLAYGLYSIGSALVHAFGPSPLELWATLGLVVLGVMLILAAAFVRASMPGGLALALGALLGLQSLALHNAAHLYGQVVALPQLARAFFAATLVVLAYVGLRTLKPPDQRLIDE